MWQHHLENLLHDSWGALVSALGTTTLAIVLAVFAFVFILAINFFLQLQTAGWIWSAAAKHFAQNLAGSLLPSVVGTLIIWSSLIGWFVVRTIYRDHLNMVSSNQNLRQKNSKLVDPTSRDLQIVDLKRTVQELEKSKNEKAVKALYSETKPPPAPPIQDMRVVSQEWVSSQNRQYRYQLKVVIQANVVIQPVSIVFSCNVRVSDGYATFAGDSVSEFHKFHQGPLPDSPKSYKISFESPFFGPEKNMVVMLFSDEPIKVESIKQVPYTFP